MTPRPARIAIIAAVGLTLAAPALAQLLPRLSPAQARAALFGIDMRGYSPTEKFYWRECIDPKGETLYETPQEIRRGRMHINSQGQACFAYEDTDYKSESCFHAKKAAKGLLRFESDTGAVFVTTEVRTGIKKCVAENPNISAIDGVESANAG